MMIYSKISLNNYPKMDKIADIAKAVKANSASAAGSSKFRSLPPDFEPTEFSVICARGKRAYESAGNRWFRALVEQNSQKYANASNKMEKSIVVSAVVETVRKASPVGSFIRKIDGRWQEVSEGIARERVGQTFRDIIDSKYRSSTHAKKRRRAKLQAAQNAFHGIRRGSGASNATQSTDASRRNSIGDESFLRPFAKAKQVNDADEAAVLPQWLTQDVLTTSIFSDQHVEPSRLEFSGLNNTETNSFNLNQAESLMTNTMNCLGQESLGKMPAPSIGINRHNMQAQDAFAQQAWRQEPTFPRRAFDPAPSGSFNCSNGSALANAINRAPPSTSFADSSFRNSCGSSRGSLSNSMNFNTASAPSASFNESNHTVGSPLDCLANAVNLFEQHPLIGNANCNQQSFSNNLNNINNMGNLNSLGNLNNLSNFNNLNNNNLALLAANAMDPAPAPQAAPRRPMDETDSFSFVGDDANPSDFNNYRAWFGEDGA